jgi:hypothetical protein
MVREGRATEIGAERAPTSLVGALRRWAVDVATTRH